jgi:hypothetical protein
LPNSRAPMAATRPPRTTLVERRWSSAAANAGARRSRDWLLARRAVVYLEPARTRRPG